MEDKTTSEIPESDLHPVAEEGEDTNALYGGVTYAVRVIKKSGMSLM